MDPRQNPRGSSWAGAPRGRRAVQIRSGSHPSSARKLSKSPLPRAPRIQARRTIFLPALDFDLADLELTHEEFFDDELVGSVRIRLEDLDTSAVEDRGRWGLTDDLRPGPGADHSPPAGRARGLARGVRSAVEFRPLHARAAGAQLEAHDGRRVLDARDQAALSATRSTSSRSSGCGLSVPI